MQLDSVDWLNLRYEGNAVLIEEKTVQRYLPIMRLVFSAILCASVMFYVYRSIHWQVMCDTSIMHYVNFLMAHGMAPYRDIIDVNMPGSYFIEGLAMHVFGGGDLGWRLYEFSVLALMTASLIVIAIPYDWFAGLFAGVLFILIHALDGPTQAAERDEVMVTLIVAGYALLFTSMRKRKPLFMLPFGFVLGLAASIKPTAAPLGLILLVISIVALGKENVPVRKFLIYGLLGFATAFLLDLGFLFHYHAFGAFIATAKRLIPYYANAGNKSVSFLVQDLLFADRLPRGIFRLILIGLFLTYVNRKKRESDKWEQLAIALGILFGALSFVAQRKGFIYHAYPFKVFVFLWLALECVKAMHTPGWRRVVGTSLLALGVLAVVPKYTYKMILVEPMSDQQDAMKADLIRLGGSTLQNQVQCLDMVDGCLSTLYRLNLVQSTYFIGDHMFFGPVGSTGLPYYRDIFWNDLHRSPPRVIILTNDWLGEPDSFEKINQWPQMAAYLDAAYKLEVTRRFGFHGYKIYLLRAKEQPIGTVATPIPQKALPQRRAVVGE